MFNYFLKKILTIIPFLWIVITLTFFLLKIIPGGPFDSERNLPLDVEQNLNQFYNLNQPILLQYLDYLNNLLHLNLGPSFKYPDWTVTQIILDKLPVSAELGLYSLLIALSLGITLGITGAILHQNNKFLDCLFTSINILGISLPTFVIAPLLILFLSIKLRLFAAIGWHSSYDKFLPAFTLSIYHIGYISRLTRSSMIEILKQDFIRTAKAKGLSTLSIYFKHALKNAISPVISYLGPAAAGLVTGSFVIESLFHIPGLGRFFVQSAFNRDYTLLLGIVLCYSTLIMLFNLLSDLILVWLNPRLQSNKT